MTPTTLGLAARHNSSWLTSWRKLHSGLCVNDTALTMLPYVQKPGTQLCSVVLSPCPLPGSIHLLGSVSLWLARSALRGRVGLLDTAVRSLQKIAVSRTWGLLPALKALVILRSFRGGLGHLPPDLVFRFFVSHASCWTPVPCTRLLDCCLTSVHVSLVGLLFDFCTRVPCWTAVFCRFLSLDCCFLQVSFFGLLFCAGVLLWTTVLSAVSCWTADIYI